MHYTVTVGYESEQLDREGNPRLTKSTIIVQAESNAEANITASKFLSGDTRCRFYKSKGTWIKV